MRPPRLQEIRERTDKIIENKLLARLEKLEQDFQVVIKKVNSLKSTHREEVKGVIIKPKAKG